MNSDAAISVKSFINLNILQTEPTDPSSTPKPPFQSTWKVLVKRSIKGGRMMRLPKTRAALSVAMLVTLSLPTTQAQEKVRVGKAVPEAFSFAPLDVGMQKGIFKKHGLDIDSVAFGGDAKMQQAAAAGSLEFMLGSGPGMGFIAKGSPVKAVATMAGPPLLLVIVVRPDGPKTPADLKGKRIAVSTPGSLTYYLVAETSQRQGWGPT